MKLIARKISYIACLLYAVYLISTAESNNKTAANDESRLFEDLFVYNKYGNSVRPVKNKTRPVQVFLDVALVQLIDLDDGAQTMETNIWIRMSWYNEVLLWNPKDYGGVESLVVNKVYPWKPDLVLYNNAENGEHGGSVSEFRTRVQLHHDGLNTWYIPAILKSSCGTDITYFPFDSQLCYMKFGSWTYLSHEINLTNSRDTMDLRTYLNSSSFYLRSAKAVRNVKYYPCCKDPFIDITYELMLDRQPGFHFFNVILPSLVITTLALMNFLLPDLIGERVGLTFDCFLANTFTTMMVKDMMPVSSDTMPVITKFMLMCMVLIYFSLLTSSFSMMCRMRVKMPNIIRLFFIQFLGPLLCVTDCLKYCKDDDGFPFDELPLPRIPWYHQTSDSDLEGESYETSFSSGYPETSDNSCHVTSKYGSRCENTGRRTRLNGNDRPFSDGYASFESRKKPSKHQAQCLKNIKTLVNGVQEEDKEIYRKEFWEFVAKIVDRLFLMAFVICWITMAIALFLKVPSRPGSGK